MSAGVAEGAPVLSTAIVDELLAEANWEACRDMVLAHVRKQQRRIAELEAAATEYLEATVALDLRETEGGQLNRNLAAERRLRDALRAVSR